VGLERERKWEGGLEGKSGSLMIHYCTPLKKNDNDARLGGSNNAKI